MCVIIIKKRKTRHAVATVLHSQTNAFALNWILGLVSLSHTKCKYRWTHGLTYTKYVHCTMYILHAYIDKCKALPKPKTQSRSNRPADTTLYLGSKHVNTFMNSMPNHLRFGHSIVVGKFQPTRVHWLFFALCIIINHILAHQCERACVWACFVQLQKSYTNAHYNHVYLQYNIFK